jgi:hypothetical protein
MMIASKNYILIVLLCFPISSVGVIYGNHAQANTVYRGMDLLPLAIKVPSLEKGTTFYFLEDNKDKIEIIQETLNKFKPAGKITSSSNEADKHLSMEFFNFKNKIQTPKIEFKRVNPTKFRLRMHGVKSDFPLIFSENFHHDWHLYLVPWKHQELDPSSNKVSQLISSYKTLNEKDPDQVSSQDLVGFVQKGWISDLGKEEPDKFHPYNFLMGLRKKTEHEKIVKTDFISKNFSGTIQNNNLPDGGVNETWSYSELSMQCLRNFQADPKCQSDGSTLWSVVSGSNSSVFLWPKLLHWKSNGFANSWWIFPESIKNLSHPDSKDTHFYNQNSDGSIDFEMVIEFWPQRIFYWGISFSLAVFVLTLSMLIIRYIGRKLFLSQAPHKINKGK